MDGLVEETVDIPEPQQGEVRMRVRAVSLNRRDQLVMAGALGRLPDRDVVPLSDGAGEIDAVGPGVTDWQVGDRVASLFFANWVSGPANPEIGAGLGAFHEDGMLAEYVVLPAERVVAMPEGYDFEEAATLPCAGVTAWNAVRSGHPIDETSKVLVMGSGGVSLFSLLFARTAGAQVIATTGHDAKADDIRKLGASEVINYRENAEWGAQVLQATGGVDKIVELGGLGTMAQSLMAVGFGGEIALVGMLAGPAEGLDVMLLHGKGANIRGVAVGSLDMYRDMKAAIEANDIRPPIYKRFGVDDIKSAYETLDAPDLFGKIVVTL
ncbi:zinc-dependent alcohol dehydrogenase family protein [Aurantiacibacter rhizosphaerae]|nr:NAD(P)-dependent alcohol dehydrogenase [Aurantiacibacter rhizosphaerae]